MKRLPLLLSFLFFILLSASLAYWGLQLFQPPLRPIVAPAASIQAEIQPGAAAALFGAQSGNSNASSDYQLKGILLADNPQDSIAILSVNGQTPKAIPLGHEIAPGVVVKEIHPDAALISENGVAKSIPLPASAKPALYRGDNK
jgi:general secretion pathway protein C